MAALSRRIAHLKEQLSDPSESESYWDLTTGFRWVVTSDCKRKEVNEWNKGSYDKWDDSGSHQLTEESFWKFYKEKKLPLKTKKGINDKWNKCSVLLRCRLCLNVTAYSCTARETRTHYQCTRCMANAGYFQLNDWIRIVSLGKCTLLETFKEFREMNGDRTASKTKFTLKYECGHSYGIGELNMNLLNTDGKAECTDGKTERNDGKARHLGLHKHCKNAIEILSECQECKQGMTRKKAAEFNTAKGSQMGLRLESGFKKSIQYYNSSNNDGIYLHISTMCEGGQADHSICMNIVDDPVDAVTDHIESGKSVMDPFEVVTDLILTKKTSTDPFDPQKGTIAHIPLGKTATDQLDPLEAGSTWHATATKSSGSWFVPENFQTRNVEIIAKVAAVL